MHEIKKSLNDFFGGDYTYDGSVKLNINVNRLINLLVTKTEADINNYASSTATDFMEAYYKARAVIFSHIFDFLKQNRLH
jgi:hypothetical protein